jgi:50S ribosomal protein L16 3-hydroxylase
MPLRALGGLTAQQFLRRHWQKKPLLVRGALPQLPGGVTRARLAALAARADVESRLVQRRGARWNVVHGPLRCTTLQRNSTLLVSGVEQHVPAAARLLEAFGFLPRARLDDVMVSWAAPGGGVGPHVDSYDVFLVQGEGRRIWRLEPPRNFALVPDAPLRLIADFSPDEELLAEPGDLLYLPPGWGHDGVALEDCLTYSIGLRAPQGQELPAAFLDYLHERGLPAARYRDPDLRPARRRAEIPAQLVRHAATLLGRIRWRRSDVSEFLGRTLTTPKPHLVFRHPRRPLSRTAFARRLQRARMVLDARTQMLTLGPRCFINGESLPATPSLRTFADRRSGMLPRALAERAYDWYLSGYLHLERGP